MTLIAFLAAAALVGPAAGSADAAAACSKKTGAAAVVTSSLPQHWKDEALHKYGPIEGLQGITCRDFTRDGRVDMALSFYSGGTAGDVAWVVFRRAERGWKLALARLQNYKQSLAFRGPDIIETQPIYLKDDGNCCPSGGYDHRRFHWNASKFVLARFWHDASYAP